METPARKAKRSLDSLATPPRGRQPGLSRRAQQQTETESSQDLSLQKKEESSPREALRVVRSDAEMIEFEMGGALYRVQDKDAFVDILQTAPQRRMSTSEFLKWKKAERQRQAQSEKSEGSSVAGEERSAASEFQASDGPKQHSHLHATSSLQEQAKHIAKQVLAEMQATERSLQRFS
eukprot:CAMPEP_0178422248 /NCGR_PEP_ID=MMETSP0689_2-20121128/27073_1 /TAXON_ID=160604 /ORGANISM="Amphidinium massartii, Strain CS-259" /LENGTH=177 /DNA_ID=CAMNT_0020043801 /DNA_START=67 /DNA_END=600 /DNA_ORIENTATION=+